MTLGDILSGFINSFLGGSYEDYPGSCFTAIAAAFATQGYWIHSDMLHLVGATNFQHFVILIYLCAAIGGLVGMALGAPPKMYLWFFMGPPIYHFLIGTTVEVRGVAWRVAGRTQDMEYVAKLASTGINKDKVSKRLNVGISDGGVSANFEDVYTVSLVFAEVDGLVSDTVQTLTDWIGVYSMSDDDSLKSKKWYLLSNLKWGFLDTITSARISTPALRYGLVHFANSKCGRAFRGTVDPSLLSLATNAENGKIPSRIFRTNAASATVPAEGGGEEAAPTVGEYDNVIEELNKEEIWLPPPFRELLNSSEEGGFQKALKDYNWSAPVSGADPLDLPKLLQQAEVKCSKYLDLIVRGMRWEAGNVFTNIVGKVPNLEDSGFDAEVEETDPDFVGPPEPPAESTVLDDYAKLLVTSMLYGWDVKYKDDPFADGDNDGRELTDDEAQQYIVNLIFVHLLRNEFSFAGSNLNTTPLVQTSDQMAERHVEEYQKIVGARSKYGEVYTWAMMMPYIQGVLLYILSLGYPFVCMFMVIPGWHKIIFTWMSFWVWAKIWDLGFAIVMLLERSVWATLGNTETISRLNPMIAQMNQWGTYDFTKITGSTAGMRKSFTPYAVTLLEPTAGGEGGGAAGDAVSQLTNSLRLLERSMVMFQSLDFDLQNSYYIYIMAALYFGVPAITGQLVLGAKAAVAGLVTNAFTNMAQETGGKAGEGIRQQGNAFLSQNQSMGRQAMALGDTRAKSLAGSLFEMQNQRARLGAQAQLNSAESQGIENKKGMVGTALEFNRGLTGMGRDLRARFLNPSNVGQNLFGLFTDEKKVLGGLGFLPKETEANPLAALGGGGGPGGGMAGRSNLNGAAMGGTGAAMGGGTGAPGGVGRLGNQALGQFMGSVYAQADSSAMMAETALTLMGQESTAQAKIGSVGKDMEALGARMQGDARDFVMTGPNARVPQLYEAFQQESMAYGMADWQNSIIASSGSLYNSKEMGDLSANMNYAAASGYFGGAVQSAFEYGPKMDRDPSTGNLTGGFSLNTGENSLGNYINSGYAGVSGKYGSTAMASVYGAARANSVNDMVGFGDNLRQNIVRAAVLGQAGITDGMTQEQKAQAATKWVMGLGDPQNRANLFGDMTGRMDSQMLGGARNNATSMLGLGSETTALLNSGSTSGGSSSGGFSWGQQLKGLDTVLPMPGNVVPPQETQQQGGGVQQQPGGQLGQVQQQAGGGGAPQQRPRPAPGGRPGTILGRRP